MPENLAGLLYQATEKYPERLALVGHTGLRDDAWTYRRLTNTADKIAWQMLNVYRLNPGERILIHGVNNPQLVANYFACFSAGLIVVPLDRFSSVDFIARIAHLTQAKILLSDDEALQLPELPKISPAALAAAHVDYDRIQHDPKPDDIAGIVFTSGTTGAPKGVILTHRNIISNVKAIENIYPKQAGIRFLSLLPLSHLFEQTAGLFAPLYLGATIYYINQFQTKAVMRKLATKNITGVIAVPQMLEMLFQGLEKQIMDGGLEKRWQRWWKTAGYLPFSWRRFLAIKQFAAMNGTPVFFVSGGAPLPASLEQRWELLGIRVIQGYGSTECAPVISVNHYDKRMQNSVGWPVDCVKIELNPHGEILVRGENVSPGYWQNDAANALAFTEQHAFRTGDIGEFGGKGELYIKGRSKDMIVLANGMNVFPEDIEQVLCKQPGVMGCMITDLPDSRGLESITAVLSLSESIGENERQALAQTAVRNANSVLAQHQRISAIRLWQGDFPRNTLLKIQRWKVKAQLVAEQHTDNPAMPDRPVPKNPASIEQLLANVCNVPVESITDTCSLDLDLGCNSLARVELATLIEEQLGIFCDDAELIALQQVGDLKALLSRGERVSAQMRFPLWPLSRLAGMIRSCLQELLVVPVQKLLTTSFQVTGRENLRQLPLPALFIANHSSHFDTLTILRALPRPIRKQLCIAAAADYFFQNSAIGNALAVLINAFPFSREGSIRNSLEHCGELMDNGWSILIYPEGTRSATGQLLPFKPGIGLLATGLRAPVVPVAIDGGQRILPKGATWPTRSAVKVSFGEALHFTAEMDKQKVTVMLHDAVERLLEQQRSG